MKKGMIAAVAAVAVLLAAGVFALCQREPTAADWAQNLQKQKAAPYQTGTFTPPGGEAVALKYRVFKPVIDLDKIPNVPSNWQNDSVDAFLRHFYISECDPSPTFEKYAEGFADGMIALEPMFEKSPELRNDPKAFFKKYRGNYAERKLLGEIIIDDVHVLVSVFVDEYWPSKRGAPYVKMGDGKYYAKPLLKMQNKTLDALAQDHYSVVFKHFPEYVRKK